MISGEPLQAEIRVLYMGPDDPPPAGADWPVETDWPWVAGRIGLPVEGQYLAPALSARLTVLDEDLGPHWGTLAEGRRWRSCRHRAPQVAEAVRHLNLKLREQLAPVIEYLTLRERRLAQREETLAAALAAAAAARPKAARVIRLAREEES